MAKRTYIRRKISGFIEITADNAFPDSITAAGKKMDELCATLPDCVTLGDPEVKTATIKEAELPLSEPEAA